MVNKNKIVVNNTSVQEHFLEDVFVHITYFTMYLLKCLRASPHDFFCGHGSTTIFSNSSRHLL